MKIKYKCEICGKECERILSHLRSTITKELRHCLSPKEYFDKYISTSEHLCIICNEPTEFNEKKFDYNEYCSKKECFYKVRWLHNKEALKKKTGCENVFQLESTKEKSKKKIKELFGVENYSQTEEYTEKVNNTYREKFGCDYYTQTEDFKNKSKKTCLEKYGVEYSLQSGDVRNKGNNTKIQKYGNANFNNREKAKLTSQQKIEALAKEKGITVEEYKKTFVIHHDEEYNRKIFLSYKDELIKKNNEKFGCDYYTQSEEYKKKRKMSTLQKYEEKYNNEEYNFVEHTNDECTLKHINCGNTFTIKKQLLYFRELRKEEICTCCNPIQKNYSKGEVEIYDFIKSIYDGEVLRNYRDIFSDDKELDIYIPEKKLAIEFDGVFWHNELYKTSTYHIDKTNECEKQGIQLIHIFEDEWQYKQDIVKSRLKGLLGLNKRIFARKTKCRYISYEESEKFLNENHIQGNCVSKYRYGLFQNGELVSVMTFGKSRFGNEFELLRFANKLNVNVVGGASKLFKQFLKDVDVDEVISFADRRWSKGNLYEKMGFEKLDNTPISYYYVIDGIRHNRIEFQKHKLIKEGYDASKTEHEIMLERKIYRIYDCGNMKYKFVRK